MDSKVEIIAITKQWIERFVLALTLCPFAEYSFDADTITYDVSENTELRDCLADVVELILNLSKHDKETLSNGFTIFSNELTFEFILDLKSVIDSFLENSEMSNDFQTVVFHPLFMFEGEKLSSHTNFTNRSPYPMIHILRVDEVADAIESHEDIENVPIRNAMVLDQLSIEDVKEVFDSGFEARVEEVLKKIELE